MREMFIFLVLISTAACSQKTEEVDSNIFLPGQALVEVKNPRLKEASGLAASVNNPGLLWTHNDSGNSAEIFLVDRQLDIKLTCRLKDAVNRDWEDIAVGPGPEINKNYVYVADIGDNLAIFQYKRIYRFEEPVVAPGQTDMIISEFDTIMFQLDGDKKDTEALMINPSTKDIYIISKWEKPESLYVLKYPYKQDTITAVKILTLPFSRIVAADFSDDGNEIIMKNYKNVYYWQVMDRAVTEVLKERPHVVEYTEEPQGEAITFAHDGTGFYTIGEKNKNKKTYLYFYPRKK